MAIPRDFEEAYDGLVVLVSRVAAGKVREEVLGEEVDVWRREDCRGAPTLVNGALHALRYELAKRDLRENRASASEETRALGLVQAVLEPPGATGDREEIVEVAPPEELGRKLPNARVFRMGRLKIIFEPTTKALGVVHLSVSHPTRNPTWEELLRARTAVDGPPPHLWAWLPKPGTGAGMDPYTRHLYFVPPEEFVG